MSWSQHASRPSLSELQHKCLFAFEKVWGLGNANQQEAYKGFSTDNEATDSLPTSSWPI